MALRVYNTEIVVEEFCASAFLASDRVVSSEPWRRVARSYLPRAFRPDASTVRLRVGASKHFIASTKPTDYGLSTVLIIDATVEAN